MKHVSDSVTAYIYTFCLYAVWPQKNKLISLFMVPCVVDNATDSNSHPGVIHGFRFFLNSVTISGQNSLFRPTNINQS